VSGYLDAGKDGNERRTQLTFRTARPAASEIRRTPAFLHCRIVAPMGAAPLKKFSRGKVPHRMQRDGRNNRQNARQSTALIASPGPSVRGAQQAHGYDDDRKKTEAHGDLLQSKVKGKQPTGTARPRSFGLKKICGLKRSALILIKSNMSQPASALEGAAPFDSRQAM